MHVHMTPAGYLFTADMIMSYIDYIVRNNMHDFDELAFILFNHSMTTTVTHSYERCLTFTVAIIEHEKFLDRHFPVKSCLDGQVGDTKSTLPQLATNSIFSPLQECIFCQIHN